MPDSEYVLGKGHEGFLQLLICFDENIIKQVTDLDSTKNIRKLISLNLQKEQWTQKWQCGSISQIKQALHDSFQE